MTFKNIEDMRAFVERGAAAQRAVDQIIINHSEKGAAKDVGLVNARTVAPVTGESLGIHPQKKKRQVRRARL